jgi:hypothetical protein
MKRTECCGDEVFSLFHMSMIDSVMIDWWNWIQSSEHLHVTLVIEVSLNT